MFSVILSRRSRYDAAGVVEPQSGPIALTDALAAARTYAERSLSAATRRGHARDLAAFLTWCHTRAVAALPAEPQTLAAYLPNLSQTDRPATIARKLAAIAVAHAMRASNRRPSTAG